MLPAGTLKNEMSVFCSGACLQCLLVVLIYSYAVLGDEKIPAVIMLIAYFFSKGGEFALKSLLTSETKYCHVFICVLLTF